MKHDGEVILVTGAGSGIGRAIAVSLARAGHIVYASSQSTSQTQFPSCLGMMACG